MKTLEKLMDRLSNNTLRIQNENGYYGEVGFEWNDPVSDNEITRFENDNNIYLPESYKQFIKLSNGATLFKDIQYGQWGCKINGLNELIEITKQVKEWGYFLKPNWLVYATWLGDLDVLIFDLDRVRGDDKNYIIDGEQGEKVEKWRSITGDFSTWLINLSLHKVQNTGDGYK